ncbi:MAG: DUF3185 domain-containing protein [Gemmatimonadaceae bacterium]
MKILGAVLIILGLAGFVFGGVSFTRSETVADLGPVEITKKETDRIPVTPIASAAALVAGIALVLAASRKNRA